MIGDRYLPSRQFASPPGFDPRHVAMLPNEVEAIRVVMTLGEAATLLAQLDALPSRSDAVFALRGVLTRLLGEAR